MQARVDVLLTWLGFFFRWRSQCVLNLYIYQAVEAEGRAAEQERQHEERRAQLAELLRAAEQVPEARFMA